MSVQPSYSASDSTALDFVELELEMAYAGELDAAELAADLTPSSAKLSGSEVRLLRVKTLYCCALSIAGVFLNLYLFGLGGFSGLMKYWIANLAALTVGFILAGTLMKRTSSVRILQMGALSGAAAYLGLLLLGAEAARYVLVLGVLAGLGEGFYWTANNLSEYVTTTKASRNAFYGRSFFWSGLVSMIGPPLGAVLVLVFNGTPGSVLGYYVLFGVLLVNLVVVAVQARSLVACTELRFSATAIGSGLRSRRWCLVMFQQFLWGMWGSALMVLAPVLLLLAVHGEMVVGLLTAASAVVGALAARVAGKLLDHRPSLFVVGSVCVPFALIGFALDAGWIGIFCLMFAKQVAFPFSSIPLARANFDALDSEKIHWKDSFHRMVELEIFLNAGRLVSFVVVLAVAGGVSPEDNVRQAILVAAVLPVLAGMVQTRLNRYTN